MSAAVRAWQRFLSQPATVANVVRDFHEWHLGRPRYAVWAISLDTGPWDERIAVANRVLDGLLVADYRRQLHITLHACGFPAAKAFHNDDYLPSQFQAQCEALRRLGLRPFELDVGGTGSFSTAPYLEVHDGEASLSQLRDALSVGGNEYRDTEYVPHVTVGLYGGAHAVADVAARLAPLRNAEPMPLRVRRLALMAYDSSVIGGPLETLCEFDLADNLLVGSDDFFR